MAKLGSWPLSRTAVRGMYAGGRGNAAARRYARVWAAVFSAGLAPRRWVTLEVAGRRTGRLTRFPLGMADWQGEWYLVPMLGENCNWVRNVRAADGLVTIRRGRQARPCRLVEVPVSERPPILKRYLATVPGARPHIPVDRHASLAGFAAIVADYPAFRVEPGREKPGTGKKLDAKPGDRTAPHPGGDGSSHGRDSRRQDGHDPDPSLVPGREHEPSRVPPPGDPA